MALDSYRELIDELATMPLKLQAAAEAAGDPPDGEWGRDEIFAHLAAAEEFYHDRVAKLLNENEPALRSFGDAATKRMEELQGRNWQENYQTFGEMRGQIVSMLMSMTLYDWDRRGLHDTLGTISIEDVVESIIDHDLEHLHQLQALAK